MAMIIVVLITTMTATMIWQQWRSVQVETAERARSQSSWMLSGALDWARIILREDAVVGQNSGRAHDHLGEPWAVPLAEARLSTFLAADKDNTDSGPEAFLSGSIEDAQSRYNLFNLVQTEPPAAGQPPVARVVPGELAVLKKLCETAGVSSDMANRIASGLRDAWAQTPTAEANPNPSVPPRILSQLVWIGIDAEVIERLAPYVILLPKRTTVNLNTAPREVIAAAVDGLDLSGGERLVQVRAQTPFATLEEAKKPLGEQIVLNPQRVGVASSFFIVSGRMRLEDRILEERSLVERQGVTMVALQRERFSSREAANPAGSTDDRRP
jgi:general secretion pathway protein K